MSRLLVVCCLSLTLGRCLSAGESPVDRSRPMATVATGFGLCDGPAWDGINTLYFPDVKGDKLFTLKSGAKEPKVALDHAGRISSTYYTNGTLYLADNGEGNISTFTGKAKKAIGQTQTADGTPAKPNDLVVDHAGGVYYTLSREGAVMYLTDKGRTVQVVDQLNKPNGIILSPDEMTLYVAIHGAGEIQAYTIDAPGKVSGGRLFARLDGTEKAADGMTVDRAGNVYCCGASDVWVFSAGGKLLDKIACSGKPINCEFGGGDMRTLYITAVDGLHAQGMRICGRSPQPPRSADNQPEVANRLSTEVPKGMIAQLDIEYAHYGDRKLLMDIFSLPHDPEMKGARPAVLVVHGGGWLNGDKTKFRAMTIELARRGYVAAAIEYRLGGEAPFPAAIHDCFAAVRYLRNNATRLGLDPDKIGAVGGSAGGHLVGLMATGHSDPALLGEAGNLGHSSKLQAAVVMAGPMEMLTGNVADTSRRKPDESNSNKFLRATIDENPELYRLADAHVHISKSSTPILFMAGDQDHPEKNEPSRQKLRENGVWTDSKVYKDAKHGCWMTQPWFDQMVDDMDGFFQEQLKWKK